MTILEYRMIIVFRKEIPNLMGKDESSMPVEIQSSPILSGPHIQNIRILLIIPGNVSKKG